MMKEIFSSVLLALILIFASISIPSLILYTLHDRTASTRNAKDRCRAANKNKDT